MRENADQNNSEYGHFLRSAKYFVYHSKSTLKNDKDDWKQLIPSYARITGQKVTKQKQSPRGVMWKRPTTLLKKRTWHRCFPVKFAKFLRTLFLIEHLQWLLLYDTKCIYGKVRPVNPPSVFNSCVKPSLVPTQTPPTRSTKQAHSLRRNTQPDEIEVFIQNHRIASDKELK